MYEASFPLHSVDLTDSHQVHHSYPLKPAEKQKLAESLTHLHATTFTVPSVFIHVRFSSHDATAHSYFVGGKPRTDCTNHILGYVRTSSSRTKAHFDGLAEKIEEAWRAAVYGDMIEEGQNKGKRQKEVDELERDKVARKLLVTAFLPMSAIREGGLALPEVGKEPGWYKENMDYFQKKADDENDELYKEMLTELQERDDLKNA